MQIASRHDTQLFLHMDDSRTPVQETVQTVVKTARAVLSATPGPTRSRMACGHEVEYHHHEMLLIWIQSVPVLLSAAKLAVEVELDLLVAVGERDDCFRQIFPKFEFSTHAVLLLPLPLPLCMLAKYFEGFARSRRASAPRSRRARGEREDPPSSRNSAPSTGASYSRGPPRPGKHATCPRRASVLHIDRKSVV